MDSFTLQVHVKTYSVPGRPRYMHDAENAEDLSRNKAFSLLLFS